MNLIKYHYQEPANCATCGCAVMQGDMCCVGTGRIWCEKCGGKGDKSFAPPFKVNDATTTSAPLPAISSRDQEFLLNKEATEQCFRNATTNFLKAGLLLKDCRDKHLWDAGYESFREYVEDLSVPVSSSYSWAMRLIGVAELCEKHGVNEERAYRIGVGKLALLVPQKEVTAELIEEAEIQSTEDLRETLGYKRTETDKDYSIRCEHCGYIIHGARFVTKQKEEK